MWNMVKYYAYYPIMFLMKLFWLLPVEPDTVLFISYGGSQYSDSPRSISEAIHEKFPQKKIVWAFSRNDIVCPDYIEIVPVSSFLYYKALCTAGTIISNLMLHTFLPIRKSQIVLETWHGEPFKLVGFRATESDVWVRKALRLQGKKYTAILSSSRFFSDEVIRNSFGFQRPDILRFGLPRNDLLFQEHASITQKICDYFSIENDGNTKLILYAPTFRGDNAFMCDRDLIDANECGHWFEERFQKKFVFLFRAHHAMKKVEIPGSVNATYYPDMQELLCAADILITDYSSCMNDYSLMKKPVFLYIPDYEQYIRDRGIYYDIRELPFPYATTRKDLEKSVRSFSPSEYEKAISEYHKKIETYDHGKATERVLEWFEEKWQKQKV